MTLPAPTEALLARIHAAVAAGRDPLIVFDLDGTLYDNTHRTLRIIQEFAYAYASRHPALYRAVAGMSPGLGRYRLSDTLAAVGVDDPGLVAEVHAYWFERFFTDDYVVHDLPLAGAVEFVRLVHEAGAMPAYLTGRDAPNMLLGTIAALQRDGFPIGPWNTRVILKPDFETADLAYKASVIDHLDRSGAVVGAFDNEPGLCNMFQAAFPDATVVWLDTSHAPGAPPLTSGIVAVRDFSELLTPTS